MHLVGNQKYEVTIKTSNQLWADTKAPIYIQFIGIQGKTPIKVSCINNSLLFYFLLVINRNWLRKRGFKNYFNPN